LNIKEYIGRALDLYLEELQKSEYAQDFIKNHGISFKDLRRKKLSILVAVYEGRFPFFKLREIGRYFYNMGIPYSEFLNGLDKIKCYLNRELLRERKLDYHLYLKIVDFFNKAKDFSALGYLDGYIGHDIQILKLLYEKEEDTFIAKNFIKNHILWLISILETLEKQKKNEDINLKHESCRFSLFLKEPNVKRFLTEKEISIVDHLHRLVHTNAQEVFFHLEKKEYSKLLHSYISLIRNSLALLNLLAVVVMQKNIIEVKIDPLTGLLNRRAMDEILEHNLRISVIAEEPFTIAMADIDNFKKVNDKFGHLVGDCVLKHVAKRIKENLRKSDFVFRYGGEEFLILLPSTKKSDAVNVLEKIRKDIENFPIKCDKHTVKITVSIGVSSVVPDENTNLLDIIKDADIKLYEAKKTGKNKVVY
jgi:diguanylate cyclase (GGDEF)-like protein